MQMIMNLIRQFLGGNNQMQELLELLQNHLEKNGGNLNIPDGLIPAEAQRAIENALGDSGILNNLPAEVMKPEIIQKLLGFLQQDK